MVGLTFFREGARVTAHAGIVITVKPAGPLPVDGEEAAFAVTVTIAGSSAFVELCAAVAEAVTVEVKTKVEVKVGSEVDAVVALGASDLSLRTTSTSLLYFVLTSSKACQYFCTASHLSLRHESRSLRRPAAMVPLSQV